MSALTPYDTGARMEPALWSSDDHDDFGKVDFGNDEGDAPYTVWIEGTEDAADEIHIENHLSDQTIIIVGGIRITVSADFGVDYETIEED